jgi:hypothetical protein
MPDWMIALIVASIPSITSLVIILMARRKDKAELADKFQKLANQTADDLIKERNARRKLEKRQDATDDFVSDLLSYISGLLSGIKLLSQQIIGLGHTPCFQPAEPPARKVVMEDEAR